MKYRYARIVKGLTAEEIEYDFEQNNEWVQFVLEAYNLEKEREEKEINKTKKRKR